MQRILQSNNNNNSHNNNNSTPLNQLAKESQAHSRNLVAIILSHPLTSPYHWTNRVAWSHFQRKTRNVVVNSQDLREKD